MELLYMYLSTIGTSYLLDLFLAFRAMKDVSNEGLKYDIKNANIINNETKKLSKLIHFIPVFNMINSLKNIMMYSINRSNYLDSSMLTGLANYMSKEEYNYYKEKPSLTRAFIINTNLFPLVGSKLCKITSCNIKQLEISFDYTYDKKNKNYIFFNESKNANLLTQEEKVNFIKEKKDITLMKLEEDNIVCFSSEEQKGNTKLNIIFKLGNSKEIDNCDLEKILLDRLTYIWLLNTTKTINEEDMANACKDGILDFNYFIQYQDKLNSMLELNNDELIVKVPEDNNIVDKPKMRVRKR